MQIHQDAGISMVETDALWEEHRGIAVGVEDEDALMQLLGLIELVGLSHKPLEYLKPLIFQPLRMPLHAEDGFIFATLHRLDDAIGRLGDGTQLLARYAHCLVMERVDKYLLLLIYIK